MAVSSVKDTCFPSFTEGLGGLLAALFQAAIYLLPTEQAHRPPWEWAHSVALSGKVVRLIILQRQLKSLTLRRGVF